MAYYYSSQSGLYLQNSSGSNLVNLITKGFNVDFLPLTLDKINNRVGINNTTPQFPLDINGSIRANSISFATDCYLRKSENDDMVINIPPQKKISIYETGGLGLFDINSSTNITNIYTKATFYNHIGILIGATSNFALSVNGLFNCQDALIYNNITAVSAIISGNTSTNTLNVIGDTNGGDNINVANNITGDKVFTNILEVNGDITSSAFIRGNQMETNFIYSKQGGLINGILEVEDFTAINYLKSLKTGSVSAFSMFHDSVFDLARGYIRGLNPEPGSGQTHLNHFDCIRGEDSPYVGSYGEVNPNLIYGTELVTRSGLVEESTRLFEIGKQYVEKSDITQMRFIFRLYFY